MLIRRRVIIVTTLLVVIAVVVAGTLLESTPLAFSFVITTTLQRSPSQHPQFFKPVRTTVTARSYNNHGSKNFANCCVFQSLEFPLIALELAEKLAIPLVTATSLFMDTVSDEGDAQQQQYQHAIVIEPYTYENRIHNYSIGIVSLNDPCSTTSSNKNRKSGKRAMTKTMNPFQIDFMPPINSRLGRRTNGDSGQPDLLLKAVRLPPNQYHHNSNVRITTNEELPTDETDRWPEQRPTVIYDITAGFGQDSLLIAHSLIKNKKNSNSSPAGNTGYVHMIERNPIIATLLQDALRRLRLIAATSGSMTNDGDHQSMAQQLSQCVSMEWNDGFNALTNLQNHRNNGTMIPDVVYFDPMFPTRKKTASVKKNMQILHSLLLQDERTATNDDVWNKDEEESRLLQLAYQVARSRVVVKRPIHAPSIDITLCDSNTTLTKTTPAPTNTVKPSYQITGSINRWDVYNKQ